MHVLVNSFIKKESSSGIILIFVTILALAFANSAFSDKYYEFLNVTIHFSVNELEISKPLYLWINDGLMALFFLVIGLEIKREIIAGHLSSWNKISLPTFAAIGGMFVPAMIYIILNYNDPQAMKGWAIPTATDIAFSLGILALLGTRVPLSLKVFLMALAIIDDVGAIIIIAVFYTENLSLTSLYIGSGIVALLFIMNRLKITPISLYIIVGIALWVTVLKSGVHATLAGIILAFVIPLNAKVERKNTSPSKRLEKGLHYWVAFFVLPLFAFANAGVDLRGMEIDNLLSDVPLGIFLGLFLGKQIGVFLFTFIAVKLGLATLPKCTTWLQIYGIAVLTGIGFTMSLFINSLAFGDNSIYLFADRLAILLASVSSGLLGYLILRFAKKRKACNIT